MEYPAIIEFAPFQKAAKKKTKQIDTKAILKLGLLMMIQNIENFWRAMLQIKRK